MSGLSGKYTVAKWQTGGVYPDVVWDGEWDDFCLVLDQNFSSVKGSAKG